MSSESFPTWKNCTVNEANYQNSGMSIWFCNRLFAYCSVPHTYARQRLLPKTRLAESNSFLHSLGGYKGDARARLKSFGESKLVAATHLQCISVPHEYASSPAFSDWGVKITRDLNLPSRQMQSSKNQRCTHNRLSSNPAPGQWQGARRIRTWRDHKKVSMFKLRKEVIKGHSLHLSLKTWSHRFT